MATIVPQTPVTLSQNWGVQFCDYRVDGKPVDFQDLMITVSEKRAVSVEGEVVPLTTRIKQRNTYLDQLGTALAEATAKQASFKSEDGGGTVMSGWFSSDATATMVKAGCSGYFNQWNTAHTMADATKSGLEGIIQKLKSTIDGLNNKAQTDMTRLQQLVDRRDESYSTASNLMTSVSDTRSNTIRNL